MACASEFLLTSGNHSERKFLIDILANGVTYICDRGYFSFDVLAAINKLGALFVFRIKNNYRYVVGKKLALSGLLPICFSQVSDELVRFSNDPQSCVYRVVRFKVLDTFFILCTNRCDLTTVQIIMLYAYRWRIELIFKFLKRTLNGLHLFAHHQQGAPIHFYLLLITAVLQMHLKQSFCQQQQHNKSVSTPSKCIQNVKMEQFDIENLTNKNDTADKWVHNINTIFTDSFKISVNWLLYLNNYLAHNIDYHIVSTLATA